MQAVASIGKIELLPGDDWCMYEIVAEPDEAAVALIDTERQKLAATFGLTRPTSRPVIHLASLYAKEMMEDTWMRWLQRLCAGQIVFSLALHNYSGIPQHTLCLRLQTANELKQFTQKLEVINTLLQPAQCPPLRLHCLPYISIGANLTTDVFDAALAEYSQAPFYAPFTVSTISVLRRQNENDIPLMRNRFGLCHDERLL